MHMELTHKQTRRAVGDCIFCQGHTLYRLGRLSAFPPRFNVFFPFLMHHFSAVKIQFKFNCARYFFLSSPANKETHTNINDYEGRGIISPLSWSKFFIFLVSLLLALEKVNNTSSKVQIKTHKASCID